MLIDETPNQDTPVDETPDDSKDTPPAELPADDKGAKDDSKDDADDGTDPDSTVTPDKKDKAPKDDSKDKDSDDSDDDDNLSEEDQKKVAKLVDKKLAPFQDSIYAQRVDNEVNKILVENPEYKPYEARIRRWVNHPNRATMIKQGLPVKSVVIESITPYLQKIGAEKSKAADAKADKTRIDGGSQRPSTPGAFPDFSKMSSQEIEDTAEQVKRGTFKAK